MLNRKVLKCHEHLITLETLVQGKTMDNRLFICETGNIIILHLHLHPTQGYQIFSAVRLHNRRQMYDQGKK